MRVPTDLSDFRKWSKARRSEPTLAEFAAYLIHNEGMRLKALDPTRGKENERLIASMRRVIERCCQQARRFGVSDALKEAT